MLGLIALVVDTNTYVLAIFIIIIAVLLMKANVLARAIDKEIRELNKPAPKKVQPSPYAGEAPLGR